jgi:hypothetical protein
MTFSNTTGCATAHERRFRIEGRARAANVNLLQKRAIVKNVLFEIRPFVVMMRSEGRKIMSWQGYRYYYRGSRDRDP